MAKEPFWDTKPRSDNQINDMPKDYYRFPFQPDRLMRKEEHARCSLPDSVAGLIHLIAVTSFGEYRHDSTFGCEIWEHDFENIGNSQIYKERLRNSIQFSIEKHETRITNVKVSIQIDQIDYREVSHRIKSRIRLRVDALLAHTNEPFVYNDQFFIGPLSYY